MAGTKRQKESRIANLNKKKMKSTPSSAVMFDMSGPAGASPAVSVYDESMNPLLSHEPDLLHKRGLLQGVRKTVKYKRGEGDAIVVVASALVLQASRGTELITRLQPVRLTNSLDSDWYEFSIVTNTGAGWTKNCFGQVRSGTVVKHEVPEVKEYTRHVSTARWYQQMRKIGMHYGPSFRGLNDLTAGITENVASGRIVDYKRPGHSAYAFHPTSLDWVFQSLSVAAHNGTARYFYKMCLPLYIGELYITPGGEDIKINMATDLMAGGSYKGSAHGVSDGKLRFLLKGMKITPFDDTAAQVDEGSHGAVHLEWRPDIDFIDGKTLLKPVPEIKEGHRLLEALSTLCSMQNYESFKSMPVPQPHLEAYKKWTEERIARARRGENPMLPNITELFKLTSSQRQVRIEEIMEECRGQRVEDPARAIYVVYQSVVGLYEGQADVLDALLKDNVLTHLYNFLNADCTDFIKLLGHSKPNLKVLEIGAGTGGLTALILADLKNSFDENMFSRYTYTDISAGFFVTAKERFQEYANIDYAVLDISQDPTAQGFEKDTYDLIIASNVLHATPSLNETLKNCRTLLKPQGRLFLQELCSESKWINYIMGVLPGWWLGAEDGRPGEPYCFEDRWDKELRAAGFAGVDAFVPDQPAPYQFDAHIIARPMPQVKPIKKVRLLIASDVISPKARAIQDLFVKMGFLVNFCTLDSKPPAAEDVVSLLDLDGPFLHDVSKRQFEQFIKFVSTATSSGILWITQSVQINCKDPRYGMIVGMGRTIRSELGHSFATLEIDQFGPEACNAVLAVFEKFQRRSEIAASDLNNDSEFALSNGMINVRRFHWISVPQELSRGEDTASKGLWVGKPGLLQSLQWKPHDVIEMTSDDVEIDVRAGGLNFKDVLRALGVVQGVKPEGNYIGQDYTGIVRRVGRDVTHVKPGDRVMSWTMKAFSTRFITPGRYCVKMPDNLSFNDAATMALVYITVFEAVQHIGRLEAGQTILIHSGTGGVGFAAIQVAQMIGAESFVTVGSEEKAAFITKKHGIPRDHIFHSRDESFTSDVLKATNGRGVDVVLNSLSGELLHASWKCVAEYGIFVDISKRDLIGEGRLAMEIFEANRGYHGVDVSRIGLEKPEITAEYLNRVIDYYEKGLIKPVEPITTFEAANIQEAFRFIQKGQHLGKIVIEFPQNADDLPTASVSQKLVVRDDVSYFIPGGLGGLGQAISIWLASHGATNLIYLSRSGSKKVDKAFFNELEDLGYSAQVFTGDIRSFEDVKNAVSKAAKPIGGVIQMSMVLKDRALGQMSFEDWQTAVIRKVPGTWNVHEATKDQKLDFFVLFSSASGTIGQSGQVNYASSNTFQDAFVQYRQSLGLAASVLDIGVVEDIGYVSENPQFLESLRSASFHLLSETDLLECLQLIMSRSFVTGPIGKPSRTEGYLNPAHLVLGLKTPLPLANPSNRSIWKRDPRMAAYRDSSELAPTQSSGTDEVLKRFLMTATLNLSSLTSDKSVKFLSEQIEQRVLGFLMTTEGGLDKTATLNDIGIDSLVAIELRNWWKQNLSSDISVLELLNASLDQLGRIAGERLRGKLEENAGTGVNAAAVTESMNGHHVPVTSEKGKVSGAEYILMKSL